MSCKPIIFSGPMVRAILEGRKTMTRRVIKHQPHENERVIDLGDGSYAHQCVSTGSYGGGHWHLPYNPGDVLWVRENCWAEDRGERCGVCYDADTAWIEFNDAEHHEDYLKLRDYAWKANEGFESNSGKLVPSIFMPRWASRITLRVTDVKIERLQDISDADAIAEGASSRASCHGFRARDTGWSMDWSRIGTLGALKTPLKDTEISLGSPKWAFASYWNVLHGPGSWDANPWVAAITFEKEPRP